METPFPQELTTLSAAWSEQIKVANQLWAFAATTTMLVVTAAPDEKGQIALLGFSMSAEYFFPLGLLLLAALNIAYCSVHLQAHFTLKVFYACRSSLHSDDEIFAGEFTYKDATDSMLQSQSYDRVYPFVRLLPPASKSATYRFLKWIAQVIYTPVPLFGCTICAVKAFSFVQPEWLRLLAISASLVLPLGATLAMALTAVGWMEQAAGTMEK